MTVFEPPQGWGPALIEYLGIEPWRIPIVMLSALGIYLTFLVLVRIFGVRVLSGWNGFDAVIIIMFGAVAGRVIIGHPPTLASGMVGLGTLMLLESIFGAVQSVTGIRHINHKPRVIMAHGKFVVRHLKRSHLAPAEVYAALRKAGVSQLSQVQCVVLEATGQLSIVREGVEIDPQLLRGVVGADKVLKKRPGRPR
ncbi:DUF421 domain-containing protein [Rothia nasimurium]|uniref:DUF421 domain-containing protein n=1 Tax=Rothia nasimurium TaxID=85336 RepID=UPI001F2E1694|nr:YetF domain-containing protein [Rothia nasimurium]